MTSISPPLIIRSPAKINYFLKILAKRSDGYHELFSAVQTLSFFDEISLDFSEKDSLVCDHPELQVQEENLAFRALVLFKKKSGVDHSFQIHLKKNIPLQSGLGGGSSNVATVLFGLNSLCGNIFTQKELQDFSAEISSDAPLFFVGGSSIMEGRGEKIRAFSTSFSQKQFVIIVPKERLSTALVYGQVKNCFSLTEEEKLQFLRDFESKQTFCNDLQPIAYQLSPRLKELTQKLEILKQRWWMSGSGSAHVLILENPLSQRDLQQLRKECLVVSARAISRSSTGWYK